MIFGVYGAALAGFLTSAVPEWTDTTPRKGRALLWLLALWLPGRLIGLLGIDALVPLLTLSDLGFFGLLFWYVLQPIMARGSSRHTSFPVWLALFVLVELALHIAWLLGKTELAARLLQASLM